MKLEELFEAVVHDLNTRYGQSHTIERDKRFGKPCLTADGHLFAILDEGLALKLPEDERRQALMLPGVHAWQPGDPRDTIRQWVVLPSTQADEWADLAAVALTTVLPGN